jgi:subtilisin family serine protease
MQVDPKSAGAGKHSHSELRSASRATFTDQEAPALAPGVRLAMTLIEKGDWLQLQWFTGIKQGGGGRQHLPLFVVLDLHLLKRQRIGFKRLQEILMALELDVPKAYWDEMERHGMLPQFPARIFVDRNDPSKTEKGTPVNQQLATIAAVKFLRLREAARHSPCLEQSLADLGLPADHTWRFNKRTLDGSGIVVGIIDDGCALAHRDFLVSVGMVGGQSTFKTRVLRLWDQASTTGGGNPPDDFDYGREIKNVEIDAVVAAHVGADGAIDEEAIYTALQYQPGSVDDLATHGTHVMSIAAGNGQSLIGARGVAPGADLIFVQLPRDEIENETSTLSDRIVDGVVYIFTQAEKLGKSAAVVNISYGGYRGAHDGTSGWESQIDLHAMLAPNRAVVVAAGNGFEAKCHANGRVLKGAPETLGWVVKPEDPTGNELDLWYNGDATLAVSLRAPDGVTVYGPFPLGTQHEPLMQPGSKIIIGWVDHTYQPENQDKEVFIVLRPTVDPGAGTSIGPAPSGTWSVVLENTGTTPAQFHAWIQRDDQGKGGARRQQSTFEPTITNPDGADPGYTLGDFATGKFTIAVGAYNTDTQEVARYSACGPTRPSGGTSSRRKPECCAPAAEDALGRGVLSASTRRALPTRMNGTSASAPHVAGLVALIFEYATKHAGRNLTAEEIRSAIAQNPQLPLKANRHQQVDTAQKKKQQDVWLDLVGAGRINFKRTMRRLFP